MMLNFNNFAYHKISIPDNAAEKKTFLEDLKQKFVTEMKESQVCCDYLKQFNPNSTERFMNDYAEKKVSFLESFDYLMRIYNQEENEKYLVKAREVLSHILQKKLFNLQLQWRAGLVDFDEIQTSYDFNFWEKHVEYCPFIPPITNNELELMKKYLIMNFFSSFDDADIGQIYFSLMEKDEEGLYPNMPDWYDFYDSMFGNGQLLLLPNIKGDKEQHYLDIAYAANNKEIEEQNKNNPPTPYIPSIHAFYTDLYNFVEQCEQDEYFKTLFNIWHRETYPEFYDKEYDREFVDSAIDVLESADRPITLPQGVVWHQAIINAAERYTTDRILEALDPVYEEYATLVDLGITKRYTPEEEQQARESTYYFKSATDMILKGRELCGEPRNFDFLKE